jgi:diguanylate cyclase (GGDEF)-like protein
MNGIDLVKAVRIKYSKSRLPIIGMSGEGGGTTSAYFLKAGANDYIHKPFLTEELYCRVMHNLENSEYIAVIRDMAENDFLTGIYNRRSFFNYAEKLFAGMKRGNHSLTIAMLDIDHFKKCNDTYGHDAGDAVIQFVANSIADWFRKEDVVARIGGEEFCVACINMKPDHIMEIFDGLRRQIESSVIKFQDKTIRVTISTGVCPLAMDSLEEMVKVADNMLYQAKNTGRNQVCVAS